MIKRIFGKYVIVWAVCLVLFNVVAFLFPVADGFEKFDENFLIGYSAVTAAFIVHLICANCAFRENNATKLFYSWNLKKISFTGLVFIMIFGIATMAIPFFPFWAGIVLCVLVIAFTLVSLAKATAAIEIVEEMDEKIKNETSFIKSLTIEAETLVQKANNEEIKANCKKVFEAIRYSDPMSNDALAGVESQITLKFNEFSGAVTSGAENIGALADELVVLIGDRNKKCKLLK